MDERAEKMKIFQRDLGEKLAKIRKEKKIKAYELGVMAGVSQPTISAYENGEKWPRLDILISICDALGVSVTDMLQSLDNEDSYSTEELLLMSQFKSFIMSNRKKAIETGIDE